jgi:hypothetical protein
MLGRRFTRYTSGELGTKACSRVSVRRASYLRDANTVPSRFVQAKQLSRFSARDAFEHFCVRRKFFDEHE